MAKNTMKNERRGFIRHRSQYYDTFSKSWLKRDTLTGLIVGKKNSGPWKGVRLEQCMKTEDLMNHDIKLVDCHQPTAA